MYARKKTVIINLKKNKKKYKQCVGFLYLCK